MKRILLVLALATSALAAPQKSQRIVGGSEAEIEQYPFMVSMIHNWWGIWWLATCGGALLTSRSVLSAAHCYDGNGAHDWRGSVGSKYPESGTIHDALRIIIHDGYSSEHLNHDVAIIHLREPVTFSQSVGTASIAGPNYNLPYHTVVSATGWGAIRELSNLLNSSNEGKSLLAQFGQTGLLNNVARRKLCNIIVGNELKADPNRMITSPRLHELACQIKEVFNKENTSTYFIPFASFGPFSKEAAKGKLLDTFRHRRREFLRSGIITTSRKRTHSDSSSQSDSSGPCSPVPAPGKVRAAVNKLEDASEEFNVEEALLWLKNSTDPWFTVDLYWDQTSKSRLSSLSTSSKTIGEYFDEFKALRQQKGLHLYQGPSAEVLQHVQVYTVNHTLCVERYAFLKTQPGYELWPDVTDNMKCAGVIGQGGRDACQGDSGGPLLHNNNVIVGVTSWGFECADRFYPGVYATISRYTDWVVENAI